MLMYNIHAVPFLVSGYLESTLIIKPAWVSEEGREQNCFPQEMSRNVSGVSVTKLRCLRKFGLLLQSVVLIIYILLYIDYI